MTPTWRKVEDEMPEEQAYVWVYDETAKRVSMGLLVNPRFGWVYRDGGRAFGISHWQPISLPAAPTEDE
jgi:hypothetical protein